MNNLIQSIDAYHEDGKKLILIIGRPGSGKSKIIHNYSQKAGIPIIDFSQILNDQKNDPIKILSDFLKNYRFDILLIDNKKELYKNTKTYDILDILKQLSENVTVVTTWNGFIEDGQLSHIVGSNEEIYPIDGSFSYIMV